MSFESTGDKETDLDNWELFLYVEKTLILSKKFPSVRSSTGCYAGEIWQPDVTMSSTFWRQSRRLERNQKPGPTARHGFNGKQDNWKEIPHSLTRQFWLESLKIDPKDHNFVTTEKNRFSKKKVCGFVKQPVFREDTFLIF